MIYSLLIVLISGLLTLAIGLSRRYSGLGRFVAAPGVAVGLLVALFTEGLPGEGAAGRVIEWPAFLAWLGRPIYESDALSGRLGAWCLLLGALYLWRVAGGRGPGAGDRRAGIRNRRSGTGDRRSGIRDRRWGTEDRRSGTGDRRSSTQDRRSRISGW